MGLDARRGPGFPPEQLYDDILPGGKTKSQRSRKVPLASRRRKLRKEMAASVLNDK